MKSITYLVANFVLVLFVLIIIGMFFLASLNPRFADASAPTGLPASIATSSNPVVTTTAATLFATSSCAARIVTTYAAPVMLTFSDYANQTPTALYGHLQPASTTVVYDSGQYGCGLVKAYSFATQAITVSESR